MKPLVATEVERHLIFTLAGSHLTQGSLYFLGEGGGQFETHSQGHFHLWSSSEVTFSQPFHH